MPFEELYTVAAAYEERLFHEVRLPGLRATFGNLDDKECAKIVAGTEEPSSIRQKAFELLALELMPHHMRPDEESGSEKAVLLPIEGMSQSAARGLVKAVSENLVRHHPNWLILAPHFERIRVTAEG